MAVRMRRNSKGRFVAKVGRKKRSSRRRKKR
jgi:hypothetical protein